MTLRTQTIRMKRFSSTLMIAHLVLIVNSRILSGHLIVQKIATLSQSSCIFCMTSLRFQNNGAL